MAAPSSLDLRERVLAAAPDDRLSPGVIAARFCVANSTVRNWLRPALNPTAICPGADRGYI